jgi:peptidylprolyl isomerase
MDRNRNLIIIVVVALVAAVALGLVFKGASSPTPPPPQSLGSSAPASTPTTPTSATKPPSSGRAPPTAPTSVPSYQTTSSGLQWADITPGSGDSPQPGSVVVVEYSGFLQSDGSLFDSSYKRSKPFTFVIGKGNVIPGWDEGVMSMKVGGKRQLVIPAALGYGHRGSPPKIPPDATLVFDVELLDVKPPRVAPEAPTKVADKDYTTTPSGLKYKDFVVGTGASPTMGQTVSVEYTGWLTNGKKFDSSYDREGPVQFKLGSVIEGWNEGLQSMKVGGKRQLWIPAGMAYGDRTIPPGAPPGKELIPPNSPLVFEVELLDVK